ncbi:uncharacterized protein LOC115455346 [Manduca sexta]|uniref:uncharacterized protein LOC115455346 n=1 Tax=Manduca sexta TaxID=7130 RepID=UPI001890B15C|nr:uncharacterized protein LOC115455346 [Manduca sexta]
MESVLRPPETFKFENNLLNTTSGNLSRDWDKWKKSFNTYFEACELKKKDNKVLLHVIGDQCREVYDQFKVECKTVNELLEQFDKYFIPKKNLAVERHKFFKRDQHELESTEQYVFELNKIAANCDFENLRDDLVCSRLICGIRDMALAERLLREPDITLPKALDICRLAEMSRVHAQNIKQENGDQHVHQISQGANIESNKPSCPQVFAVNRKRDYEYGNTRPQSQRLRNTPSQSTSFVSRPLYQNNYPPAQAQIFRQSNNNMQVPRNNSRKTETTANRNILCKNCGRRHKHNECFAYGQRCNNCYKMNHYARMCRVGRVHEVQEDDSTDQVKFNNSYRYSDWLVDLKINNQTICFKLDTGADVNVLPRKYLGKIHIKESKSSCEELKLIKRVMDIGTSDKTDSKSIFDEFPSVFEVAPAAHEAHSSRDYLEAQAQVCALTTSNPLTDTHFYKYKNVPKMM